MAGVVAGLRRMYIVLLRLIIFFSFTVKVNCILADAESYLLDTFLSPHNPFWVVHMSTIEWSTALLNLQVKSCVMGKFCDLLSL